MSVKRLAAIVFVAFSAPLFSIRGDVVAPEPGVVELAVLLQTRSHAEPWLRSETRFSTPAFSLDGQSVIALNPAVGRSRGAVLRPPGASEYALNYLWHDPELGLAFYRADSAAAPGARPTRTPPGRLRELTVGKSLSAVGVNERRLLRRQVVYQGIVSRTTPWGYAPLPLLRLSGWEERASQGEIVFSGGAVVGVVVASSNTNEAFAVPIDYIVAAQDRARLEERAQSRLAPAVDFTASVVPESGFRCRPLSDEESRRHYGVATEHGACVVTTVMPWLTAIGDRLYPGDAITGLNGRRLPASTLLETAPLGAAPPELALQYQEGRLQKPGASYRLDVVRHGERRTIQLRLGVFDRRYLRTPREFDSPAYWVFGGLVFVELSERYLEERREASWRLRYLAEAGRLQSGRERERYVVLDRVLETRNTVGYRCDSCLVQSVNGVAVRDLQDLKRLALAALREPSDPIFGLEGGMFLALSVDQIAASDQEVRERYRIEFLEGGLDGVER